MLILNVNCIFCSYNKQCECCRMFMFSAHAFTFILGIKQFFSNITAKNIWTAENISTCGRCSIAAVSAIAPYNIEK